MNETITSQKEFVTVSGFYTSDRSSGRFKSLDDINRALQEFKNILPIASGRDLVAEDLYKTVKVIVLGLCDSTPELHFQYYKNNLNCAIYILNGGRGRATFYYDNILAFFAIIECDKYLPLDVPKAHFLNISSIVDKARRSLIMR